MWPSDRRDIQINLMDSIRESIPVPSTQDFYKHSRRKPATTRITMFELRAIFCAFFRGPADLD
jgi:hypothetical protein